MENIVNTQNDETEEDENYEFEFNFINMPWDDRTKKSKVGILTLLVAIFAATMACLVNSFFMYYRGFVSVTSYDSTSTNSSTNCQLTKMDEYPFATRIHSLESKKLICVGALVNDYSVMANGACVKSGPIHIDLGSIKEPRCRVGFTVDEKVPIYHVGVMSKNLFLLTSRDKLSACGQVIPIGLEADWDQPAHVIGRTFASGRSLSRQPVSLAGKECHCMSGTTVMENIICVTKKLTNCPILVGDLLVQKGRLLGFASTSAIRSNEDQTFCFADLNAIAEHLKELGVVH